MQNVLLKEPGQSGFILYFESEEFGRASFQYDSEEERMEGFQRLHESCRRHFEQDGIIRYLSFQIGDSDE